MIEHNLIACKGLLMQDRNCLKMEFLSWNDADFFSFSA